MNSNPVERARGWFGRDVPLTKALIVANLATLVLGYAFPRLLAPAYDALGFDGAALARQPWTLLTYPLVAYPGAVDRGTCMGCHRGEGALATPFYGVPVK